MKLLQIYSSLAGWW